jgi:hypothetical protein
MTFRKKASLQEYWDMLILDGWRSNGLGWGIYKDFAVYSGRKYDGDIYSETSELMDGIEHNLVTDFKRDPKKPVRALVAEKLPKLNAYLWNNYPAFTDETDKFALKLLASMKVTKKEKRQDLIELRALEKEDKRTRKFHTNLGHRRSDWHIVKPTNN